MASRVRGRVKFYSGEKGYGFIQVDGAAKDIFVHATAINKSGLKELNKGDKVEFDIETVEKGQRATVIKVIQ